MTSPQPFTCLCPCCDITVTAVGPNVTITMSSHTGTAARTQHSPAQAADLAAALLRAVAVAARAAGHAQRLARSEQRLPLAAELACLDTATALDAIEAEAAQEQP